MPPHSPGAGEPPPSLSLPKATDHRAPTRNSVHPPRSSSLPRRIGCRLSVLQQVAAGVERAHCCFPTMSQTYSYIIHRRDFIALISNVSLSSRRRSGDRFATPAHSSHRRKRRTRYRPSDEYWNEIPTPLSSLRRRHPSSLRRTPLVPQTKLPRSIDEGGTSLRRKNIVPQTNGRGPNPCIIRRYASSKVLQMFLKFLHSYPSQPHLTNSTKTNCNCCCYPHKSMTGLSAYDAPAAKSLTRFDDTH
jgi:hypothetical protein